MLLAESTHAHIFFDDEIKAIQISWKGNVPREEYQEMMLKSLTFFKEKQAVHWIINQKERQALNAELNLWVVESFFPQLLDLTNEQSKIAVIVSEDVFGRFAMRSQTQHLENTYPEKMIPYQQFFSEMEAKRWLLE